MFSIFDIMARLILAFLLKSSCDMFRASLLLLITFASSTFAWFIYATKVSTGITAHIEAWNILFTNEEKVTKNGNFKNTWKKYYDQYEDIKDYKIGFELSVDINGETQTNLLLNPKNQHKIYPYLYAYTYDDIHNSGYYSHVTMDTLKDDTVFSSIKLYLHNKTNEITSPITLTAFTYKDDNDFLDGHYRGNSKYTITIYNK